MRRSHHVRASRVGNHPHIFGENLDGAPNNLRTTLNVRRRLRAGRDPFSPGDDLFAYLPVKKPPPPRDM